MAATTLIDRALIRLSGAEARGFLQGLVTNDVAGPLPVYAALLTPQGKALFDFIVWSEGDDPSAGSGQSLLIDCERTAADDLAKRLKLYRLRRPIEIGCDDSLAVHWSPVGDAGVADPRDPALGRRWIAPPTDPADGWHAHRLAVGVPEGRAEIGDGTTLWLEANARELNGVSFTKGCYVGQENTARMHHRGKVNRAIGVVPMANADPVRIRASWPAFGLAIVTKRTGTGNETVG